MRIRKDNDNLLENDIELIAKASDALAHPARVEIFRFIYTRNLSRIPVCTKDIVAEFNYSQATVSQHMNKLLISGLIESEKKGNFNFFYVNLGALAKYIDCIKKLNAPK